METSYYDDIHESFIGSVQSIRGQVIVVDRLPGLFMHELVIVGHSKILGEVTQLQDGLATIQTFENISGLGIDDPVVGLRKPLTMSLGPGIMANVYDGIQRSFKDIQEKSHSVYIPKGLGVVGLDESKQWYFEHELFKVNDYIIEGDIFGKVQENVVITHKIMLPPGHMGRITWLAEEGYYTVTEPVIEIEYHNKKSVFPMMQSWPVRTPRPFTEQIANDRPLLTGQRALDGLFPLEQGGTCALVGPKKDMLSCFLYKSPAWDATVYISEQRESEFIENQFNWDQVEFDFNGQRVPVKNRSIWVGNTHNMILAAREACMYTGITVAEYLRDMGIGVTVYADSISSWVESLREVSAISGETPGEEGFPISINTRLNSFFGRSGKVICLGSPAVPREGYISIIGTLGGGQYSDPVPTAVSNIVQTWWTIDGVRSRHIPILDCIHSFSKTFRSLENYYCDLDPEFATRRSQILDLLKRAEYLYSNPTESMRDTEQLTLYVAGLIRDDFLYQNIFMPYEIVCPISKTSWMMRNILCFYHMAQRALEERYCTWTTIKEKLDDVIYSLRTMKFQDTTAGITVMQTAMDKILTDIRVAFDNLRYGV